MKWNVNSELDNIAISTVVQFLRGIIPKKCMAITSAKTQEKQKEREKNSEETSFFLLIAYIFACTYAPKSKFFPFLGVLLSPPRKQKTTK